jgi:homoserine O-acetyltransferase
MPAFAILFAACGHAPPRPELRPEPRPEPTVVTAGGEGAQRIAELGTCVLGSGEKIEGCRIGYRTFGKLDAAKSNLVLFPTWFTGTTEPLARSIPDKLVDTNRFFLVLVDSIGDGVSSSPSNSTKQPRLAFPHFTIGDMVESQRRLVKETFGVTKVHTVMGISMGGMQAFEWAVVHGDETARAISIVGTPQLTSHDLLLWNAELHALDDSVAYAGGNYQGRPRIRAVSDIHWLMLATPAFRASETSRAQFPAWIEEKEADTRFDWNDWHRQLEAMLVHDVARADGGSLDTTAKRTKTKMLVVVADQDHMVHPGPSKAFAKAQGAKLVVLPGPCGHAAPTCDGALLATEVRAFFE